MAVSAAQRRKYIADWSKNSKTQANGRASRRFNSTSNTSDVPF